MVKDSIYFSLTLKYGSNSVLLDPLQTKEGQKIPENKKSCTQLMFLVKFLHVKLSYCSSDSS